ncbi:MAG: VWA domain-containing protein, partial [Myxococcales bacterium]
VDRGVADVPRERREELGRDRERVDVLAEPPVDSLSVAAQFFPSFTGDICNAAVYAEPVVSLKASVAARSALLSAMSEIPDGTTPTGPALEGALTQARLWARQRPDEAVAVVLATDGQPTECSPIATSDLASLAAAALVDSPQQPGVPTFVVGILGVNDLGSGAREALDAIARSGGTGTSTLVDPSRDVTEQFSEALRSVATRGVSCSLALPSAVDDIGKLSLVNVALTTAACGRRVLSYVDSAADCASGDGWTYDVDPTSGTLPKKAILCPLSCERYRAGAEATIEVGCLTQGWTQ